MRYWSLATVSSLTAFALFAVAGSIVARLGTAVLASRAERRAPAVRARLLWLLRILPGLVAVTAAFGIALPIFLWFEETDTTEPINLTLGLVASGGACLIAAGVWRACAAWRATARVRSDWERRARVLPGLGTSLPSYAIDDAFPTVAVIGILRPRLFVAERVLRECSPEEIAAIVAHECAHVAARDNLKRLIVRACPGMFGVARELDRAWNAAAEQAADAGLDAGARLNLADALIHVSRLAMASKMAPLVSAFYVGGSVDDRVRRLVEPPVEAGASRWSRVAVSLAVALLVAGVILAAPAVHEIIEGAVQRLP